MSKQLYRAMVLGCVLIWLLIGMSVSGLLAGLDAGLRPELNELLVPAFLGITGVLNAAALLRYPASVPQNASSEPAALDRSPPFE